MDCREAETKLSWVLDGEAPEVAAHVEGCGACAAKLESLRQADALLGEAALAMLPPPKAWRLAPTGGRLRWAIAAAAVVAGWIGWIAWGAAWDPIVPVVTVLGATEWTEGTEAVLRVVVRDSRRFGTVGGAPVTIAVEGGATATAATDADGVALLRLPAPAGEEARVTIAVVTPWGTRREMRRVPVRRPVRLLVTTDKPFYQPGQTVHVRLLALDNVRMAPWRGDLSLTIDDAQGNRVLRRALKASEFGIASADLPLAEETGLGRWRVRAAVGGVESERTFDVRRYVLPKFRVDVKTDLDFYAPGDRVAIAVDAAYLFGKPCDGARVTVTLGEWVADAFRVVATSATAADSRGHARTDLRIPDEVHGTEQAGGDALLRLEASVTDAAGHVERKALSLPVSAAGLHLAAFPEGGRWIPKLAGQRVYLIASYPDGRPAKAALRMDGGEELTTDADGVVAAVAPGPAFDLEARDVSGRRVKRRIDLASLEFPEDGFVLRTDSDAPRAGSTLNVTLLTVHDAVFYLDLLQGPATLLSTTVRSTGGRAEAAIDLPAEARGTLVLAAWRIRPDGQAERTTLPVVVRTPEALTVTAVPSRDTFRPGEEITAEVRVTDRAGRPVPSALGLSVVDDAVWALSTARPGMEQAFFEIREDLLKPRWQVLDRRLPATSPVRLAVAEPPPMPVLFRDDPAERLRSLRLSHLAARRDVANVLAVATAVVAAGWLAWILLPHGLALALAVGVSAGASAALVLAPARSDLVALFAPVALLGWTVSGGLWAARQSIPGPARVAIAVCGMATAFMVCAFVIMGTLGGRATSRMLLQQEVATGGAPAPDAGELMPLPGAGDGTRPGAPRLREFFPETLAWNPEIITDDQGRATLRFPGADSITTWRLGVSAVDRAGRLGAADVPVRVFQPFFADLDLPVSLTQGDEVWIPVTVFNWSEERERVEVVVESEAGFELVDGGRGTLDVPAGGVAVARVHLRAREIGRHRLKVTATGTRFADALARTLDVTPDGHPVTSSAADLLKRGAAATLTVPSSAIPGTGRLTVRLLPSRLADLVTGLDSLARMPYG